MIDDVEGWLRPDAIPILLTIADEQERRDIRGGVAEIGVHHGKLLLLLALLARPEEGVVAVDLFERQHLNRDSSGRGDLGILRANLARVLPEPDLVAIVAADSTELRGRDLVEAADGSLRLVSVDGGHTEEVVRHDLATAAEALRPGGVVLLDDFFNPRFPGVAAGAMRFLLQGPGPTLVPFATGGDKLWLALGESDARAYLERLRGAGLGGAMTRPHAMLGHEVLCIGPDTQPALRP